MPLKTRATIHVLMAIAITFMFSATYAADPFKGSGFQLDESDLALMKAAAEKLYMNDDTEVGSIEDWSNPQTDTRGIVTLLEKSEYEGMPCSRLRHDITFKRHADPYRFILTRCRTASGEWKILTQ